MWSLKNDTKLFTRQTHRHRKLMVAKGKMGRGVGDKSGAGADICTLLYTEQVTSKDPLYSTGNSIQHLIKTWDGKESKAVPLKLI